MANSYVASSKTYTLDSLAPEASVIKTANGTTIVTDGKNVNVETAKKKGVNAWILALILAVVIGVILYFTHPAIVLSRNTTTNELYIDWGKLILWAIGITLVIVIGLWLLKGLIGYEMKY